MNAEADEIELLSWLRACFQSMVTANSCYLVQHNLAAWLPLHYHFEPILLHRFVTIARKSFLCWFKIGDDLFCFNLLRNLEVTRSDEIEAINLGHALAVNMISMLELLDGFHILIHPLDGVVSDARARENTELTKRLNILLQLAALFLSDGQLVIFSREDGELSKVRAEYSSSTPCVIHESKFSKVLALT